MGLIDLVFPKKCLECGKEGRYICSDCSLKVKKVKPICPYCEKPSIDGMTHAKCMRRFGLDGLVSIWEYGGVIRKAILALKYKFAKEIAKELADFCVPILNTKYHIRDTILVPIPLHWHRENWRGFNQVEEIGKLVAREMKWKFEPNLLIRKKWTAPQAGLDMKKRSENIQGVFSLNTSYQLPNTSTSKTIVLLDDVWTTGSTMKEAAKILKRAGAKSVWGLTIAR